MTSKFNRRSQGKRLASNNVINKTKIKLHTYNLGNGLLAGGLSKYTSINKIVIIFLFIILK